MGQVPLGSDLEIPETQMTTQSNEEGCKKILSTWHARVRECFLVSSFPSTRMQPLNFNPGAGLNFQTSTRRRVQTSLGAWLAKVDV